MKEKHSKNVHVAQAWNINALILLFVVCWLVYHVENIAFHATAGYSVVL